MIRDEHRSPATPRNLVNEQVAAMLDHIDTATPELRSHLFEDALSELSTRTEISVQMVPENEVDNSACSVAGGYLAEHTPPVLVISESASQGRRAFTALHEYGHHLQQSVYTLMDRFLGQPDGGIALEDAACDSFASEILLPEGFIRQHLSSLGPSAASILSLWRDSTQVSRAAICVRAASKLRTPGHVTLLDGRGIVAFSSSRDLPPLKRGSDQSQVSIVKDSLRAPERTIEGIARFYYRDSIQGQELYAQAVGLDGMTVVVSVPDRAPWRTLTLPRSDSGPQGSFRICEHNACGHEFHSFERPCERCGVLQCPECGQCNCAFQIREATCPSCCMVRAIHLFDAATGVCEECT